MMESWSIDDAAAYLESNGSVLPEHAKQQQQQQASGGKCLLCLHSSAGSGAIFRKQLAPLKLDASFELDFLDGTIVMDPAVVPEAAMLRKFFPDAPNLAYLARVVIDEHGEERPGLLATNALAKEMMSPAAAASVAASDGALRSEYRGYEPALHRLCTRLGSRRYEGAVAFSQGANLLTLLLALLEAAERAAANDENAAAALPLGPEKAATKAAAKAASERALKRSRILRPPFLLAFCPQMFGWVDQLVADAALAARCLAAVDAGLLEANHPEWQVEADAPPPPDALAGVFGAPLAKYAMRHRPHLT
jgi:hypothetical protein